MWDAKRKIEKHREREGEREREGGRGWWKDEKGISEEEYKKGVQIQDWI